MKRVSPEDFEWIVSQLGQSISNLEQVSASIGEIAGRLDVSAKTVETHKARATEKLSLKTRAELVRYAAAQGWLADI